MSFADDGSSSLAMSMSVFGIIACPSCVFFAVAGGCNQFQYFCAFAFFAHPLDSSVLMTGAFLCCSVIPFIIPSTRMVLQVLRPSLTLAFNM